MPSTYAARALVLDAWPVVEWQRDQPAADRVEALLAEADDGKLDLHMSVVNAGEVFYQLVRRLGLRQANLFWSQLERGTIPIRLVTATTARVERAARLKAQSRISYADAFAVTLAQELGIAIVTGDPEIRALTPAVAVEWLGS